MGKLEFPRISENLEVRICVMKIKTVAYAVQIRDYADFSHKRENSSVNDRKLNILSDWIWKRFGII